jgi:iron complex transport system ATP-binding protein
MVEGRPTAGLSRRELARSIAHVPQAEAGVFSFTVADLVLMGRTAHLGLFDMPGRADRERALEALDSLGIADLADRDATRISGGQRQLALIARALAQDARAIVMDEPTASLDFGNRLRVLDKVEELAARGLGVVLSTHEPEQAFAIADKVAVIAAGRLFAHGAPEEVLTGETLSQVYGVAVAVEATGSGRRTVVPVRES